MKKSKNRKMPYGGITNLMRAATEDDATPLLKMLLSSNYQSQLFIRDSKGRTALDWARLSRNYNAVSLLMKAMSSNLSNSRMDNISAEVDVVNFIKETNEYQANKLVEYIIKRQSYEANRLLVYNQLYRQEVEESGEIFFTDTETSYNKSTPLILASGMNMINVVNSLIELKIPIDQHNSFGHTALTYACASGHSAIVRMLLFNNADIFHLTVDGRTGLHYACMYAKAKTIKTIFDFLFEQFSIFRMENHSNSSFDASRWSTYSKRMEALINIKGNDGKTALELLPQHLPSGFDIESRLKLSLVKSLDSLRLPSKLTGDDEEEDDGSELSNKSNYFPTEYGQRSIELRTKQLPTIKDEASIESSSLMIPMRGPEIVVRNDSMMGEPMKEQLGLGSALEMLSNELIDYERDDISMYSESEDRDHNDMHPESIIDSIISNRFGDINSLDEEVLDEDLENPSRVIDIHDTPFMSTDENDTSEVASAIRTDWSHDTDNMHAVGIHNITSSHTITTALSLFDELNKIHELFSHAKDRIAIWKDNAFKEDELSKLIPCPLSCGQSLAVEDTYYHVKVLCQCRTTICKFCQLSVQQFQLDHHVRRNCPKRIVACPNAFRGCAEMMTYDSVELHVNLKCKVRLVCCRQFCDKIIPLNIREDHEQNHCKNRHIQCDKCHIDIICNQYSHHLHEECVERLVKCRIGCGLSFKAKDLVYHENNVCVGSCQWNCGHRMGPPERLKLHEYSECTHRPTECCYDCGTTGLTFGIIQEHQNHQCRRTPLKCFDCGTMVCRQEFSDHSNPWIGDCISRKVRCPSNLIGWKVHLPSNSGHLNNKDAPPVEGLITKFRHNAPHDDGFRDEVYIKTSNSQGWFDAWNSKFVPIENDAQESEQKSCPCEWIVFADRANHLSSQCIYRNVSILDYEDGYNGENISLVNEKILQGGQVSSYINTISALHLKNRYEQFLDQEVKHPPQTACQHCGLIIDNEEMEDHTKLVCLEVPLRCPYGCGKLIHRKSMESHTSNDCVKRLVRCIQCEDGDLWAEELEEHQRSQCPMRIVPCPLNCDRTDIYAKNLSWHVDNECDQRMIHCACGMTKPHIEMADHLQFECNERYVNCPQGCGQSIKFHLVEGHVEVTCPLQRHRYQKIVSCPLGCTMKMMVKELTDHISNSCVKRLLECPQYCGNTIQFDKMEDHLSYCPRRSISCEPGMKCCEQFFYHWFYHRISSSTPSSPANEESETPLEPIISSDEEMAPVRNPSILPSRMNTSRPSNSPPVQMVNNKIKSKNFTIQLNAGVSLFDAIRIHKPSKFGPKDDGEDEEKGISGTNELLSELNWVGNSSSFTHPTEISAVYMDGHQMKMRNELRMYSCQKHRITLLMTAVRFNMNRMAEYIVSQCRESVDIDLENKLGDTALTIACRMGKIDFVELLIQHGADVNKETTNGKTALIEATKCEIECTALLEFLIEYGSIAGYKTRKHMKSALSWAKVLKRPHSIRILELAGIVQQQTNVIFQAISCGNYDLVKRMIADGTFFDPNIDATAYRNMDKYARLALVAKGELSISEGKMKSIEGNVERSDLEMKECKSALMQLEEEMNVDFGIEEKIRKGISKDFSSLDKLASKLTSADVSEIIGIHDPSPLLRLAVFTFAIMFELIREDVWPDALAACETNNSISWWKEAVSLFKTPRVALLKLKSFNVDKLLPTRMKDLVERSKALYVNMIEELQRTENEIESKLKRIQKESILKATSTAVEENVNANQSFHTARSSSALQSPTSARKEATIVSIPKKATIKYAIPEGFDEDDWTDSDEEADTKLRGSWVKGEWVPHTKELRRENRLKREMAASLNRSIDKSMSQSYDANDMFGSDGDGKDQDSVLVGKMKRKDSRQLVRITGELIEKQMKSYGWIDQSKLETKSLPVKNEKKKLSITSGDMLNTTQSSTNLPSADNSKIPLAIPVHSKSKQNQFSPYANEIECFPFIHTMIFLLKAMSKFSFDRSNLLDVRKVISDRSRRLSELKTTHRQLIEKYEQDVEIRKEIETEYIKNLKKEKYLSNKQFVFREQVRIARLLNQVAVNGHTLLSWAACLGAHEVVDEMLSRGATVGYPAPLLHKIATFLQMSYRIARMARAARYHTPYIEPPPRPKTAVLVIEPTVNGNTKDIPTTTSNGEPLQSANASNERKEDVEDGQEEEAKAPKKPKNLLELIRDMELLKLKRDKLLRSITFARNHTRLPVPEAAYAGKWEIVELIYSRRLLHYYFLDTFIYPLPSYPLRPNDSYRYIHDKLKLKDVVAFGMNDFSSGIYLPEQGWVGAGHPLEPYGETEKEINKILADTNDKRRKYKAMRARVRILLRERRNQVEGEEEMRIAIANRDFRKCMYLAEIKSITIDLETKDGYTALVAASEEDIERVGYEPFLNDDGGPCLLVEYLLDREYYRPSIDVETRTGHTALIRACELGRHHVAERLLDRGANFDYVNRFGRTALHSAVANASATCTRILMERFASLQLKDNDGFTPYGIAERENYIGLMTLISQFGSGFLGPLQVSRGRVNNHIRCPLGCGVVLVPREVDAHCKVCELREVDCTRDCGVKRLMHRELQGHLDDQCIKRLVPCEYCTHDVVFCEMDSHLKLECIYRFEPCPLGCGKHKRMIEMDRHMVQCSWQLIDCPLQCGDRMTITDSQLHVNQYCSNRRVTCPLKCHNHIIYKQLTVHMSQNCVCRLGTCQFCHQDMKHNEIDKHEKQCDDRLEPCPSRCGELVVVRNVPNHLASECSHRFIECSLNCGLKIRGVNYAVHQLSQCPNRMCPCEYGCLDPTSMKSDEKVLMVLAKQMPLHLKYECPERFIKCRLCVEEVKAKDIASHEKQVCKQRIVQCRNEGCLKELAFELREQHESAECRFRLISCAQGCDELINAIHSGIHYQRHCKMRFTPCPLQCGISMRAYEMDNHTQDYCVRRTKISESTAVETDTINKSKKQNERKAKKNIATAIEKDVSSSLRFSFGEYALRPKK